MRYFELNTTTQIVPNTGEELGTTLGTAAAELEAKYRDGPGSVEYWASTVAQLYYLAADAFLRGAAVCGGHKRADRYHDAADRLAAKADALYAEGRDARDEREDGQLMIAFQDGYAGRDISRHGFDRREAAMIGQLYAREGRPVPQRVHHVYVPRPLTRDSERDHMLVDGTKFVVDYPDGKVANAVITQL